MAILEERGFLIVAQNNDTVDYIACATALAKSIKLTMPHASVALLTDVKFDSDLFNFVIEFPLGDLAKDDTWKLINDQQVFDASPYRQTIKLEADMVLPQSIDHWWDILQKKDVCLTVGCKNYLQQDATSRYYRKVFDANDLLDVYNAVTYWRVSRTAQMFFSYVKNIFNNWDIYKNELISCHDEKPTTDVVYAIAAKLIGEENVYIPNSPVSIVHMKKEINSISADSWQDELIYELNNASVRINTVEQMHPFHYHNKDFAKTLNEHYDRL
jgi:hypothetical protein